MRKAFTLVELLVVIAIIIVLCGCLLGPGGFDAMYRLLAGWMLYPIRLAGERNINWFDLSLCLVCLTGLMLGVHCFGQWFAASRPTPMPWPWSRTLKLIGLLMLMFVAGIAAIGVTHEMVWLATTKDNLTQGGLRYSAATYSRNNLKQMAIASDNHHDQHKSLPAGATFDANGRALHGWQTSLLPYIEQDALYKKIDRTVPWNDPKNAAFMMESIPVYVHPAVEPSTPNEFAVSHYSGNMHVLGAKPMTFKDITDGPSNTVLFGEIAHNFQPWGKPMNCRDPAVGFTGPHGFAGPIPGRGAAFAFADGSVRMVRQDINPAVLKAISTPRGGESPEDHDVDR